MSNHAECGVRNKIIIIVLLASILGIHACGYRLSGKGTLVPEGAKTIAVPAFINYTNEPYVDLDVTQAVVNEFIADGRLRIVDVEAAEPQMLTPGATTSGLSGNPRTFAGPRELKSATMSPFG